jgi:hypothetical protein
MHGTLAPVRGTNGCAAANAANRSVLKRPIERRQGDCGNK